MSRKSSKLNEISKMFSKINIKLDELSNEGFQAMIAIVKNQNDTRYAPNITG